MPIREASGSSVVVGALLGGGLLVGAITGIAAAVGLAVDGGDGGGEVATATSVNVTLSEFKIEGITAVPPGRVSLNLANNGSSVHNVVLEGEGKRSADIQSGLAGTFDLGELAAGEYTLYCDISGHRDAGMETTFVVDADAAAEVAAEGGGGASASIDHNNITPEQAQVLDDATLTSIQAFLAQGGQVGTYGNQLLEPTEVEADGTKVFDLTAAITDWQVDAETTVKAWAYNGQVPGPRIQLDVGDKVKVRIKNELPISTDIHWHGIRLPNSQDGVAGLTQDLIPPGDTYTYEFDAVEPAIAMYHPHHHGDIGLPNGLFAMIQIGESPLPTGTFGGIDIPANVADLVVDEFPMVLNDAGVIGLSLNGKSFPATQPYVFDQDDWFVVHYYNEGLLSHPMHLHGFPGLVFARDGIPLEHPYWADTQNVAPGERFSVLYKARDPGAWVWHCHILTHAERDTGIFGMVTAVIVNAPE
jgi:FtsP/CotA-like multicopper oxidase with cupredoxin domain